jgi:hypothetical protein
MDQGSYLFLTFLGNMAVVPLKNRKIISLQQLSNFTFEVMKNRKRTVYC